MMQKNSTEWRTPSGQQPKILQVGDIHTGYGSSGVIYSPLGSSGAVLAGHDQPKIVEKYPGAIRGRYDSEGRIVQTLDKLALLAGFQSWDDFQGALHGTEDGLVNYDAGEK